MDGVHIRGAEAKDREALAHFCEDLWPEASAEEHGKELAAILDGIVAQTPVILVAVEDPGRLLGFVEVGLRSHADGCDPTHSVGFIEGWYVVPERRNQSIGRELIAAAEHWARSQGCSEMASDTWIDNEPSQHAHEALGYEVVDRCVHYRKSL
jgi:aminoglycoside 6'-N-acetyltransferase I